MTEGESPELMLDSKVVVGVDLVVVGGEEGRVCFEDALHVLGEGEVVARDLLHKYLHIYAQNFVNTVSDLKGVTPPTFWSFTIRCSRSNFKALAVKSL